MNSLGVAPFVNNLYSDLKDGLVLLQVHVQQCSQNIFVYYTLYMLNVHVSI